MANTVRGAVARQETTVGAFDPTDEKVLQYLGLNPQDPRSRAVVAVAREYGLDPLLKHVIVIPKSGVYITRDGYLHVAHTSGQLDGIVVEQEPTLTEDGRFWVARVTVHRKDMRHGFTYPGRYPSSGGNQQYAPEMALKAAESHALRRAFSVSGLGSAEERFVDEAEPRHEFPTQPEPERDVRDGEVVDEPGADEPDSWPEVAKPEGGESPESE